MNNVSTPLTTGLTSEQVRLAPKNIPAHHVTSFELAWKVFRNQIVSFFFLLLIASGIVSLVLHQSIDAIIFFFIAGINTLIGFFQEFRAGKSTQALEKLVTQQVTVRRNGILQKIPSTDVVQGDIVSAEPGDVIVADLRIREAADVFLDESITTGETLPREGREGEEVRAGVSIVQGKLLGEVIAVGRESSLLMYAEKISKVEKNSSFERFIHSISTYILIFTLLCLVAVFLINVLLTHSFIFSEYLLFAVAMLVGVVPESLPLVVTVILTREALALAKQNVIVKKLSVLQNLGSMNYFFTDKTGTVTENKLRVTDIVDKGNLVHALAVITQGSYERTPMDTVFDTAIGNYLENKKIVTNKERRGENLELSPFQIARGFSVYTLTDGSEIIRGQYGPVYACCAPSDTTFSDTCLIAEQKGLRSIAFAQKEKNSSTYTLLGSVLFEDPLKNDAATLYRSLEDLSVQVKIVTGDSVSVASYIGNKLNPAINEKCVFCMDHWTSTGTNAIEKFHVYARCKPEQKSELIDEHLDHGVVGFLGEGINDALALKRADIGFVVDNATDVARQSGDVILLEKSFAPIVKAITLSRKAFAHIRTYLLCTLTGNIGTLISLTAVVIFWHQIPMLPLQILLNNLLTDVPLMFLITDTISSNVTQKPIRDQAKKFFTLIFIFALLSSAFDFIFFFAFKGYDISVLRTGWFVFSVLAELTLVFSFRSELPLFKAPKMSRILGGVLIICYAVAFSLPYIPFLNSIFHLVPLSAGQALLLVGITLVYLGANEGVKYFIHRKQKSKK